MKTGQTPDVGEFVHRMRRDPTDGKFQPDVVMSLRLLLNFHRQGPPFGSTPTAGNDETATADNPGAGIRDFRHQAKSLEALVNICTTALEMVASPLCAVCSDGRLLFANRAARCSLRQGQWLESYGGRISTPARHYVAPAFDLAMARLRTGTGSTLLLTDRRDGQRAVVSVAPVCVEQHREQTLLENLGLVWLTTSESTQTPVKHMAQLFNLTPAERNLLSCVAGGMGLRDAASHLKVSIHTVRNQLKSILNKTGRHSQAQLMTLVTRMASLRLPDHV